MRVLSVDGQMLNLTRKMVTVNDIGNTMYSMDQSDTVPLVDRAVPEILSEISETLKTIASQGIPR